jgi:cytochrome P450/CRP-like cAMP-binding protein
MEPSLVPARAAREAPLAPGLPLLGNALAANRDPCGFFAACHRAWGPVFRVRYPGRELVVIAGLEANRLFATQGARLFAMGPTYASVTRELGSDAIPNAHDGERHRALRRVIGGALTPAALEPWLPRVVAQVREVAAAWHPEQRMDVVDALGAVVSDAVSLVTTGAPMGPALARDASLYGTMMGVVGVGRAFPEWTLYTPPVRRARRNLEAYLTERLEAHRAPAPDPRPPDLLDAILAAQPEFTSVDQVAMALQPAKNAGIYLYRMLSFAVWELCRRPELRAALRAECDPLLVRGRAPTAEQIKRMPVLQGVLMETLRFYPMALALPRVVREPFSFAGYRFDAGDLLYLAAPVTHADPACFADPTRFDPTRYGPDRAEHRLPHAWAPFGLGAHACVARGFSLVLGGAILATLLHTVRLAIEPSDHVLRVRAFPQPIPEARFRVRVQEQRARPLLREPTLSPPLAASELAGDLEPVERLRALEGIALRTTPPGEALWRAGEPVDGFRVLLRGRARVTGPGGSHLVDRPGTELGAAALVVGGVWRDDAVAETEVGAVWVSRSAWDALVGEAALTASEVARLAMERGALLELAAAADASTPEPIAARLGLVLERHEAGAVLGAEGARVDAAWVLLAGRVDQLLVSGEHALPLAQRAAPDLLDVEALLEGHPRARRWVVGPEGAVTLRLEPRWLREVLVDSGGARDGITARVARRLARQLGGDPPP